MARAFNSTNPPTRWALNRLNDKLSIFDKDIAKALKEIKDIIDDIDDIVANGGAQADDEKVEKAVKWAIDKVTGNYITYSQTVRNLKNVNGMSYDCSSFIITAFYAAGIDVQATTTLDMMKGFTDIGFEWIPGTNFPASKCKRGDILLNIVLHTQMYIGNNQDVNCGHTPAEVIPHSADNYGRGWSGILRFKKQ